ncbi:MAG: hypothetical protein A2942_00965 [Candidatus Lloydbacteria bacterium RIFCSPLOWO2_01_FULL_50_20]|uniref:Cell division protein FtsL n=1 Tax=Candidatus Lloydbacteria bacterium RIFCSPLOWO2_01_FULL_50_20 TaxID=1798665 RepID=A0A1G2DI97_9BACT|nr:MAG: hypothetical protein A3C13_01435 [Candidatus Lloydbacteria bacterium RIFCSPHIGHO2_02_FULL_50_11]OGZ13404.1 MAG: hypothetical protein A2942_00965 [Candidatus Lloydbacteria bacterium RIFCSPLOWO2_01_FULL_50_20]
MLDIRQRTKLRRVLYAKPTIIAVAILVALLLHPVWGMYKKSRDAIARRDKAETELSSLTAREIELDLDIARLSTPGGVEAEIRERFMVAKEGEKVMIIAEPDAEKAHTVTVPDDSSSFLNNVADMFGFSGE